MQTPVNELLESPISAMLAVYQTLKKTMGEHLTIVMHSTKCFHMSAHFISQNYVRKISVILPLW